jgi:hypothetical protein
MLRALVLFAALDAATAPQAVPTPAPVTRSEIGRTRSLADVARERSLRAPGEPRPTAIVLELATPSLPESYQPAASTAEAPPSVSETVPTPYPTDAPAPPPAPSSAGERVGIWFAAMGGAFALAGTAVLVAVWILSPFLGLRIGRERGYPDWAGALAGLLLGPFVLLMSLVSVRGKKCPHCASLIPVEAKVCPKCQRDQPTKGPAPMEHR